MKNDFLIAITQLCAEKNLPKEVVFGAIEDALKSAYRRNYGQNQAVTVKISPATGDVRVFTTKAVVDEVTDRYAELTLAEARRIKPEAQIGDTFEVESTTQEFGRIAAQTAKQVVLQRLREAEREAVYGEFQDKEGDIVSGIIQRIEPRRIVIDLGKAEAVLPEREQVPTERYRLGQRIKAYLIEVGRATRGPEVTVSRTHKNLLRRLFELEVPEIYNGIVEIKAIAREAGSRSKVAVTARQEGIDPVGACVGLRGIRIQNIVNELNGEKIDVVQWHPDTGIFVASALSPAQVLSVDIDEKVKTATVVVPDRQLSLAIGKEGQNARLAAKLTGWRIDIKSATQARLEAAEREARAEAEREARAAAAAAAPVAVEEPTPSEVPAEQPVEVPAVAEVSELPEVPAVPVHAEEYPVPSLVEEPRPAEPEPLAAAPVGELPEVPMPQPALVPPPERERIRFAEEIFSDELGGGKKAKKKKGGVEAAEEGDSGKAPKRSRRVRYEEVEEEVDEYGEFAEKFKR